MCGRGATPRCDAFVGHGDPGAVAVFGPRFHPHGTGKKNQTVVRRFLSDAVLPSDVLFPSMRFVWWMLP